jgi:multicomponent Na+:H+ antiporter subunit G
VNVVSIAFLVAGAFFLLVSTVGLLRLPDFFTRAHAVGKSETLGALLVIIGLALQLGFELQSLKLFLIVFLIAVTNPTGIHTLSRAALRAGERVWTREEGALYGPNPLPRPGSGWDQRRAEASEAGLEDDA